MNKKSLTQLVSLLSLSVFLTACIKLPFSATPSTSPTNSNTSASQSLKGSFKDLLGLGKTLKCTYAGPEGQGTGTTYVSGAKVKTEMSTKSEGTEMTFYSLVDGDWVYQWGSPMGATKMNLKELEKFQTENPSVTPAQDYDEEFDYSCESWSPAPGFFDLPAGVGFKDITSQITQAVNQAETSKKSLCDMCNSLPAEAKASCLSSCQ